MHNISPVYYAELIGPPIGAASLCFTGLIYKHGTLSTRKWVIWYYAGQRKAIACIWCFLGVYHA